MIMKKSTIIFLFLYQMLGAQDTIQLQLTGSYVQSRDFESIILHIVFESNHYTCGPNSNFEDIYQQYEYFLDHLSDYDLKSSSFKEIFPLDGFRSNRKRIVVEYMAKSKEESIRVNQLAVESFAQEVNFFLDYPQRSKADEIKGLEEAYAALQTRIGTFMTIYDATNFEILSIDYYDILNPKVHREFLNNKLDMYHKNLSLNHTYSINARVSIW